MARSEEAIDSVIGSIMKGDKGDFITLKKSTMTRPLSNKAYSLARSTRNFTVGDSCVGCGLCAKQCPVKAIGMVDGRPSWVKDRCEICLRCLHHCPEFAIQYGNARTSRHGQYRNPHVRIRIGNNWKRWSALSGG